MVAALKDTITLHIDYYHQGDHFPRSNQIVALLRVGKRLTNREMNFALTGTFVSLIICVLSSQLIVGGEVKRERINVGICVTGQLSRLELGTKIDNLVIPNLKRNLGIHLLILLDDAVTDIKTTKHPERFTAQSPIYGKNTTGIEIEQMIYGYVNSTGVIAKAKSFTVRVRLEAPRRKKFVLTSKIVPVCPVGRNYCEYRALTGKGQKNALERFQNHMRWQANMRECMKWVQAIEVDEQMFFDYVMRVREDTYIFAKFILYTSSFQDSIVSLSGNDYAGMNDHDFIVDRKFADVIFRGIVEDYYFQEGLNSSHGEHWGAPELLLYRMAMFYNAHVKKKSVCIFPVVPIFRRTNFTHFYFNKDIIKQFRTDCSEMKITTVEEKVNLRYAPIHQFDLKYALDHLSPLINPLSAMNDSKGYGKTKHA